AMMILLECASDSAGKLPSDLPGVGKSMGLSLEVIPQDVSAARPHAAGIPYRLKSYSMDQPGIVARLTGVLRALGVNIDDLSARQESAAFAGSPLFLTEMRLTVPANVPLGQLRKELEAAGTEMNCDVGLDGA